MDKIDQARLLLQEWVDKQGHDRCWYYPEIFRSLCTLLDVHLTVEPKLPPLDEFKKGCCLYQEEEYEKTTHQPRES